MKLSIDLDAVQAIIATLGKVSTDLSTSQTDASGVKTALEAALAGSTASFITGDADVDVDQAMASIVNAINIVSGLQSKLQKMHDDAAMAVQAL